MKNVVKKYLVAQTYSGFTQRYNKMIGVLLIVLLTNILFIILPIGFFFIADIYLVVGCCFGLYLTFKNLKESQSHIKTGIIVGLFGSILSLTSLVFIDWIRYSLETGYDFNVTLGYILYFFVSLIFYALVGIIIGYLFGSYYRKKEAEMTKSPLLKKDFF